MLHNSAYYFELKLQLPENKLWKSLQTLQVVSSSLVVEDDGGVEGGDGSEGSVWRR